MDRRQIARQHRDNPRPMGVFRVLNTANGKALIATSVDVPAMLNRQRAQLKMGLHPVKQPP